jgi:hypothetical protein
MTESDEQIWVEMGEEIGTYPRGFSASTAFAWPLVRAERLVVLNYGKSLVDNM